MKRLSLALILIAAAAAGCRAQVKANAQASAGGKDDKDVADYDKPLSRQSLEQQQIGAFKPIEYAMLGARHDLNYAGEPSETCTCLAVAVGQPNDSRFSWEAAVPVLEPSTQLVVAISSQSLACAKAKKDTLGASYQGYIREGDDVVVLVEAARSGRPLTSGGIIPRPSGAGRLYLRPASKELPYGKQLDGGASCLLPTGKPTVQSEPVNTDEVFTRPYKAKSLQSADDKADLPETSLETLDESQLAPE